MPQMFMLYINQLLGMLQQVIVSHAPQTCLLLHELFVQCLSYCVPDVGSNNHVRNHNENVRSNGKTLTK
jgi:hypothetical protein